ncbi:MAG: FISUMP domain-containing protein [Bacteroidales bacterium]|nr:FISUMP domain-containing protein [Bacteroidales bacterium]MDT8402522.1 FISUMP domain-containing protein [Bacteroidales bacterium]
MKRLLLLATFIMAYAVNAQNYLISFTGTGASSTIDTVKVENLATGESLSLNGDDNLRLLDSLAVSYVVENEQFFKINIYPNPMQGKSVIEISPPAEGDAIISVWDMTGKVLAHYKGHLEISKHEFSLSGIKNGLYIINVQGIGYQFSEKLISNGESDGTAIIVRLSNSKQLVAEKESMKVSKGFQAIVNMVYTDGDRLKFTAFSGNNATVMTEIPTADTTVTFNFTECKDGDNNYYPVITINTQVWMAENLKTTTYKDGSTVIPIVQDTTDWSFLLSPAYCWYDNDEATYKHTSYGAIYNWYAAGTGNLCPEGWHVPTDEEWTTLENYLIASGYNYDGTTSGNKLAKSLASVIGWDSTSNTGAIGNTDYSEKRNATGFTTLPGGYRDKEGTFNDVGRDGGWWSATETGTYVGFAEKVSKPFYNSLNFVAYLFP